MSNRKRNSDRSESRNSPLIAQQVPSSSIPEMIAEAIRYHQAGNLTEAEQSYRKILAINPRHADSLHLLGLIAQRVGRQEAALELIHMSIECNPSNLAAYSNLGNTHRAFGQQQQALESYDKAIQLDRNFPDAYSNRGIVLHELGRHLEALDSFNKAIILRAGHL